MKKELISQYSTLIHSYQWVTTSVPSLLFSRHLFSLKPLYFLFFNHKFKANFFHFYSAFSKLNSLDYRASRISVKPRVSMKKFSMLYKTFKLRKIFFGGLSKKKKLKAKKLSKFSKLYFFNDAGNWALRGLPFTYLNRFMLSSRTYNKFFLEKMKKKLFLVRSTYAPVRSPKHKRTQRSPIPRSPVGEAFYPKPYLYFLDGVREANPRTILLFRVLKHLSFRYLVSKKKKTTFFVNVRKKLLSLKKRLAFIPNPSRVKDFHPKLITRSSRIFFLKNKVPTLFTRRALLFRLLFNSFFKKTKKKAVVYEVTLKKKQPISKILSRKPELLKVLSSLFNKKLKIRFRKFFTKKVPSLPKHKATLLQLPKRVNRAFLLHSFFKKLLSLLDKYLIFKDKSTTPSSRPFFWRNFLDNKTGQVSQKKKYLLKYKNTIRPQLLKSFSFGTYGYLYIAPLYEVFSKKGILGIVVSLYSFSFFHDIKNFFLRSYKPSITFMGRVATDPSYDSKTLDTQNSIGGIGSSPHLLHSEKLELQAPAWVTVLKVPTPYGLSRVRRIRFKPGYSRIWRYARSSLKFLWSLNFKYQHRLTVFLTRFQRFNKMQMAKCYELRVHYVLSHSYFSPDFLLGKSFFTADLVFLNGRLCKNPNLVLVVNDVVQLVVSYKYYITQRWLTIFKKKKVFRLTKFLFTKKNKIFSGNSTLMTTRFPKWLLDTIFFKSDVPKYLEIDFFTLSIFLLYEPFFVNDFNPLTWKLYKFSVLNLYNWKYLN